MKCPHCRIECYGVTAEKVWGMDSEHGWKVKSIECPSCQKFSFYLVICEKDPSAKSRYQGVAKDLVCSSIDELENILVWPKSGSRPPCPTEVPPDIASDYTEACLVLTDSPKASAALSRRCLQNILRDPNAANAQQRDLAEQISFILQSKSLPSYIAGAIDAVRNIGNFAAHPIKSSSTGQILPVEPGEAEWNLDVIESLFDFYYVQPAMLQKKQQDLNLKLQSAGKPSIKV